MGKKTALKIIVELKKELTGESLFAKDEIVSQQSAKKPISIQNEIEIALLQMGYEKKSVQETVMRLPEDLITLESQVIWAIRELSPYNRAK